MPIYRVVKKSRSIVHPTNPVMDHWESWTALEEIDEEDIRPGDEIVRSEVEQ